MHDPMVVVFDLHAPIPRKAWKDHTGRRWAFERRRRTNPEHLGQPVYPWYRPAGYEVVALGYRLTLCDLLTVWHHEPQERDSGTVCKGMGGTQLNLHNVRWAWQHRRHLSYQQRFIQKVRSWISLRCAECGHRFFWKQARFGYMGGDDTFHDNCMGYRQWRSKAQERLEVLDLVSDVWEVDGRTVQQLARNRGLGLAEEANADNKAWRVFYDLDNARKAKEKADV